MTGSLSFLRLNNILSYLSQFLYSFIDGHLGCFHIVIMRNNAAMNREVQRPLGRADFLSFRYISRRIAGSSGSTIFSCLRKHHTVSLIAIFIYIPTHSVQGSLSLYPHEKYLLRSFDITYKPSFMKFTV